MGENSNMLRKLKKAARTVVRDSKLALEKEMDANHHYG